MTGIPPKEKCQLFHDPRSQAASFENYELKNQHLQILLAFSAFFDLQEKNAYKTKRVFQKYTPRKKLLAE